MTARVPSHRDWLYAGSVSERALGRALGRIGYCLLCVLVFDLPWGESFPMIAGMPLGSWLGLLILGVEAMRILVLWQSRRPSPLHHWMLAFVAWVMLSIFWTVDVPSTVSRAGTFLQLLILAWIIWELAVTQARVRGLLQSYVLGALAASLGTIYNFLLGHTAAQLAAEEGRTVWETSRYSIAGINENDLGLILALSIPMIFYLLVCGKRPLVKVLCWLQLVAGFTAILLTASRGSLMAAILGLVMYPLTVSRLTRWQRVISLTASAGLIVCCLYLVPLSSWNRIFEFGEEVSEGTLTHRTVIWSAGWGVFRDHALLGVGAGAYGPAVLSVVNVPYVAHNTFLSVTVELGVVGALLLFGLLSSILYCAWRMHYLERCLWLALLLTWTVGVSALTWEHRKPTWLLFSLVAAHAYARRRGEHPWLDEAGGARFMPGVTRTLNSRRAEYVPYLQERQ